MYALKHLKMIRKAILRAPAPLIWTHLAPAGFGGPALVQGVADGMAEAGKTVKAVTNLDPLPTGDVIVMLPEDFPYPPRLDVFLRELEHHAKKIGASVLIAAQMPRIKASRARKGLPLDLTDLPTPVLGEISHLVTANVRRGKAIQLSTLKSGAPNP